MSFWTVREQLGRARALHAFLLDCMSHAYTSDKAVCHKCWSCRRCDVVGQFMEYVARSSTIAEVPAARVAYLGVLTSLASGPQGAQVTTPTTCSMTYLQIGSNVLFWMMTALSERQPA